jgi:hypothetical protein
MEVDKYRCKGCGISLFDDAIMTEVEQRPEQLAQQLILLKGRSDIRMILGAAVEPVLRKRAAMDQDRCRHCRGFEDFVLNVQTAEIVRKFFLGELGGSDGQEKKAPQGS